MFAPIANFSSARTASVAVLSVVPMSLSTSKLRNRLRATVLVRDSPWGVPGPCPPPTATLTASQSPPFTRLRAQPPDHVPQLRPLFREDPHCTAEPDLGAERAEEVFGGGRGGDRPRHRGRGSYRSVSI